MATMIKRDQLVFSGRGPLDAKTLVKTYAELLNVSTWTKQVDGEDLLVAYNGMIVAVWLNKDDTSKNGLYFLFDPLVTTALKKPDVTVESNWHRLDNSENAGEEISRIMAIEADVEDIKNDITELESNQTESFESRDLFPEEGIVNKIYIALNEQKSYVWEASAGYICISGSSSEMPEIQIICGGTASV